MRIVITLVSVFFTLSVFAMEERDDTVSSKENQWLNVHTPIPKYRSQNFYGTKSPLEMHRDADALHEWCKDLGVIERTKLLRMQDSDGVSSSTAHASDDNRTFGYNFLVNEVDEWFLTYLTRRLKYEPKATIAMPAVGHGNMALMVTHALKGNDSVEIILGDLFQENVDVTKSRVNKWLENFPERKAKIQYCTGDMQSLNVPDGAVNVTIARNALHFLNPRELEAYAKMLFRKTAPSGVAYFTVQLASGSKKLVSFIRAQKEKKIPYPGFVHIRSFFVDVDLNTDILKRTTAHYSQKVHDQINAMLENMAQFYQKPIEVPIHIERAKENGIAGLYGQVKTTQDEHLEQEARDSVISRIPGYAFLNILTRGQEFVRTRIATVEYISHFFDPDSFAQAFLAAGWKVKLQTYANYKAIKQEKLNLDEHEYSLVYLFEKPKLSKNQRKKTNQRNQKTSS